MQECFEQFKKDKINITNEYDKLDKEVTELGKKLSEKRDAIVSIINTINDDKLKSFPSDIIKNMTCKDRVIRSFYGALTDEVVYDSQNTCWKCKGALVSEGKSVKNAKPTHEAISDLLGSNLKGKFNELVNEWIKSYNELGYETKILKRDNIEILKNKDENAYDTEIKNFKSNSDVNKKLLKMMKFVNKDSDGETRLGGKDLADVLSKRDGSNDEFNWHKQNDAGEAIMYGFCVPDFVMATTTCGSDGESFDLESALKEHVGCQPYVLVTAQRHPENPHAIRVNFAESVSKEDGSEYELISFVCHSGDQQRGHWWALRKGITGRWWKFDDTKVSYVKNINSYTNNATHFLYKKVK